MTRSELSSAITELFGEQHGALADAARALPINYDNLRQILAGRRLVPEWVDERVARLRQLASIAPPDADRQADSALRPHLDDLADRAIAAGWEDSEITAAIETWAHDRA